MRNYNEQEWAIVYDAYVNQRRGLAYCASLVNSTINEVKHNLNLHDIHIRTQREATIVSN